MSDQIISFDPYALPPEAVRDPPSSFWAITKEIGPGIILAGTIVGSGELILTTKCGAEHGFTFLWLILFSCIIKVFVQIELGRYAISSGKPTLGALKDISTIKAIGLVLLFWWFVMMLCTVFQLGGMTGGVGQALNLAFPQFGPGSAAMIENVSPSAAAYVQTRHEIPWAVVICGLTIALIFNGSYRRIEWITTLLVVGVTLVTCLAMFSILFTEFAPHPNAIASGLKLTIPEQGIAVAFGVFGITGVGATELFYYPYWCLEKGYARYVGRDDGSKAWEDRARGWIRVMHYDAWISMVVFTCSTVAFYFMGAAVLHPQNIIPQGATAMESLSHMYSDPFGHWTHFFFLIGAGAVLFKTLYLACAANSRMTVDFLNLLGLAHADNATARAKRIRIFCVIFPLVALGFYLFQRDPQRMVQIGGIAQAATLPMMACVALYFRYFKIHATLQPKPITDVLIWIAAISISFVAAYSLYDSIQRLLA